MDCNYSRRARAGAHTFRRNDELNVLSLPPSRRKRGQLLHLPPIGQEFSGGGCGIGG